MPGRWKQKGKCKPKQHTYNVPVGFADLDRKYSKYSPVVLMDVLMGVWRLCQLIFASNLDMVHVC